MTLPGARRRGTPGQHREDATRLSSILAKVCIDQLFQSIQRSSCVLAVGFQLKARAFGGGQHHHVHDALAIHTLVPFPHANAAVELIGQVHKLHGRSGVQTQFVSDCYEPVHGSCVNTFSGYVV